MVINKCLHLLRINNKSYIHKEKVFFSPSVNEWQNSIYSFNKNVVINTISKDKLIHKIIFSYFNSMPFKFLKKKIKRTWEKVNKIFISIPEIKHNINKININIYSYNKQKSYILKIINERLNYKKLKNTYKKLQYNNINNVLKRKDIKKEYKIFYLKNLIIKSIPYLNRDKFIILKSTLNLILKKKLKKINKNKYYICLLYINYIKYKISNMLGLINILNIFYNKTIKFYIVNLKYFYLENSIISNAVVRKLNDRKKRVLKVLRKALNYIILPDLDISFKQRKTEDNLLSNNNLLNENNLFNYSIDSHKEAFKHINNKFLIGLRFQGSGRLTKRLTASRSIIKRSHKGTTKNMYSSYMGLSTIILKGHMKSNVQYLNINSHNRNGSFGLKSWLTSL